MRKFFLTLSALFCLLLGVMSQPSRTIKGRVTDETGQGVPRASVTVKGTKIGTTTDLNGFYSINVPANAQTLVASSVNMASQDVTIKGPVVDISLFARVGSLEDVVVVGYGTQKKKELTGSLTTVKGNDIADKPVQSFDQSLAGRAAGVQITIPNGVLNSPPVFRIRGTNSLSLSSYPLIVVDGVPTFTGDYGSSAAEDNPLASINPNDIESIDIAKDAAASAIYGSRAANGVVFITTKKGRPGKAKITYNTTFASMEPYRFPSLLNAAQYISFKTAAVANNPTASAITYNPILGVNGNPVDTKWFDYVYQNGFQQSHNINVSGGSDNTTYYFSAGYTNDDGIIKKNAFRRVNTLFNIDSKLNKVLTIGGKISFSDEMNLAATSSGSVNGAAFNTGGLGRLAFVLPPILTPYNLDGSYNLNGAAVGSANITGISSLSYYNPVPLLDLSRSNSENNHIQSNVYVQLRPVNWLTLRTQYGIDYLWVDNDIFWTPIAGDGYSYGGLGEDDFQKYKTSVWTNTAQSNFTIASKHNFDILVGTEQQRRTSSGYGLNRQTLSDPAYTVVQAGFTTNNPGALVLGENYLLSSFGRFNYNFSQKYLISANIRQDEYSALGVKKGVFWGVSGGWEIAKENFWASSGLQNIFSTFKLRGSYGKVGNVSGIGDFAPYSTFGSGLYGGQPTLGFNSVGNNILTWETSKKTDLGFSFGILKDRLTGEFAYYKDNITGLILSVQQAPSAGLPSNPLQNVGSMYNQGVEFSLDASIIRKKDFSWTSSFNIATNKNEVTSLAPGLTNIQQSTSGSETVNRTQVGYPAGTLWVIKTAGVDPATGKRIFLNSAGTMVYYQYYAPAGQYNYSTTSDGLTKYISPSGGTAITQAADAVMYANPLPKVYGGWNNSFRVKNFDLNILFTYQLGFYVYYGSNAGLHDQRWWENASDVLTDAWTAKGDQNKLYAKPVYGDNVSNGSAMPLDINVFKGDFVKLKNLELGYTFPKSILEKTRFSNLRFFVSGQNLAIITKYPGPDPEVSSNGNTGISQGVDRNTAVNARTVLVGLTVSF